MYGYKTGIAGLQHLTVRTGMGVGWLDKDRVCKIQTDNSEQHLKVMSVQVTGQLKVRHNPSEKEKHPVHKDASEAETN